MHSVFCESESSGPIHQVTILSVQSSKGLEFRSVIFIGLGQIDASETQAAQNMKLLYVSLTRAKESLLITASGRNEFTELGIILRR